MARRTWVLILLILFFLGVSHIGMQIYIYKKCMKALNVISLPSSAISLEKFNFAIHRSCLSISGLSIKNKTQTLKIEELIIQFDPSIFSQDRILINKVIIKGFLLPEYYSGNNIFLNFFKSKIKVSKFMIPMLIKELIVADIRASHNNQQIKGAPKLYSLKQHKLKSRAAKLNGSMDFLVYVIYFILQNSLSEAQKDLTFRTEKEIQSDQDYRLNLVEDSLMIQWVRSVSGFIQTVFRSN